nr:RecName: Full=Orcokinin [Faxonius limosus]
NFDEIDRSGFGFN